MKGMLTMEELGQHMGWPTRKARAWTIKNKVGVKDGGRWMCVDKLVQERFPDTYAEFARDIVEREADSWLRMFVAVVKKRFPTVFAQVSEIVDELR